MPDHNRRFDVQKIRQDFPALSGEFAHTDLNRPIYLDNAATTQKPQCVIHTLTQFYSETTANVHRGHHHRTQTITSDYEAARKNVADFINADVEGIIWTRGTTESINLVAYSFARHHLKAGDEILISEMEHHANIVPWQLIAKETGAIIVKIPVNPQSSELDMQAFEKNLTKKTKLVAVAHISNVTGTRHPIEQIIQKAHAVGALVLVDGAQAIAHESIHIKNLDVDFYAFSGHKCFAPAGIGVLYIKPSLIQSMPPWHGGGKIIEDVSFEGTQFLQGSAKFEAGTPNIAGALALSCAINWFNQIDRIQAQQHIHRLQNQFVHGIRDIEGIQFIHSNHSAGIVSFVIQGVHHSDLATLLDQQNIAVRSGHHCAYPLMKALKIKGCIRISIALYNTESEIKRCIQSIHKACELL